MRTPRRKANSQRRRNAGFAILDAAALTLAAGLLANLGWAVLAPGDMDSHEEYIYEPRSWEPPTLSGEPGERVPGRYRFTRGGPAGRDFGGPEIDTSE